MSTTELRESALAIARDRDWPVLPLVPRGKIPIGSLVPHGVKDATTDLAKIEGCWTEEAPDANIGIALPPGIVVVDVDPRNGGNESLEALEAEHGELPDTLTVFTGGDGRHFYFSVSPDAKVPGKLAKGVDVKQHGGYVVAPPSVHESGKQYIWNDPDQPIAELPDWVLAIRASAPSTPSDDGPTPSGAGRSAELGALAMLIEPHFTRGKRNELRLRGAGAMRHAGYSQEDAETLFVDLLPPDDGNVGKARAAVAASYAAPQATGIQRFAEELGDPIAAKQIAGLLKARSDALVEEIVIPESTEPPTKTEPPFPNWKPLSIGDLCAPRPPRIWTCRGLGIARSGRIAMIAGTPGGLKAFAAMQMNLELAAGRRVFNVFDATKSRVLHVDLEMGEQTIAERYARLLRGTGIQENDVAGWLDVVSMPTVNLARDCEDELVECFRGYEHVLIDTLKAGALGVDTNASEIAEPLYRLNRVQERVGCSILVLHHTRKPNGGEADFSGSEFIRGAVGTMLLFVSPGPDKPTTVSTRKASHGKPVAPFDLSLVDVGPVNMDTGDSAGVLVKLAGVSDPDAAALKVARLNVLKAVHERPNGFTSKTQLRDAVTGRTAVTTQAIAQLVAEGALEQDGDRRYFLTVLGRSLFESC